MAKGYDSKGNEMVLNPVWEATEGNISETGYYVPGLSGNFAMYANEGGISGTSDMTVVPGNIVEIQIVPEEVNTIADDLIVFVARAYDSKGNLVDIDFEWSAEDGSISNGSFTPSRTGTWRVYANSSDLSGTAVLSVRPGRHASLVIEPNATDLNIGESADFQFKI